MIPHRLWILLSYSRIPGNAFSFWIRKTLRWSRGAPTLPDEPKADLFAYLEAMTAEGPGLPAPVAGTGSDAVTAAEAREADLRERYRLAPLATASTRALYRKNLYLIDILEKACAGLPFPGARAGGLRALDVGSQDWHYVFGLERWLRHANGATAGGAADQEARPVFLRGVEVDGYGIYPDFRSRKDYAQAYAARTGNPQVTYEVRDILKAEGDDFDVVTLFYPFVTRHHLLLWGLPLGLFRPARLLARIAAMTRPGGWLLAFTHTLVEHELFLELGKADGGFELLRQGRALSNLVDFHADVEDRRFSVWRRIGGT